MARDRLRARPASASTSRSTPTRHDLFYIGGGQDRDQALCAEDLATHKRDALHAAAERGAVIFAVCGGYQLLGHSYELGGEKLPGVGLVDLETVREDGPRLIGNVAIETGRRTSWPASRTTAAARTSAPASSRSAASFAVTATTAAPASRACASDNVIGTYLHGPLLPKNAWFADLLTATALEPRPAELAAAGRHARRRGARGCAPGCRDRESASGSIRRSLPRVSS